MICPHCDYKDGHLNDDGKWVDGAEGEFYALVVEFTRGARYSGDKACCYACPKCRKTFIVE